MQADIKRAEHAIQSLIHDRENLKSALASAVRKKDELYKVVLEYKDALEKVTKKNIELESQQDEVEMIKNEIEKVKQQLIRRDQKIEALHTRNQFLEQQLDEQGTESSIWKKLYKKRQCDNYKIDSKVGPVIEILIQKVKSQDRFHRSFKKCSPCINAFRDLVVNERYQEIVVVLGKFALEIMKFLERNRDETSPGFSDIQQSVGSMNATSQYLSFNNHSEDDLSSNDEERVHKLNAEIKHLLEKSKEVISNRSCSNHLRSPKNEEQSFVSFDKGNINELRSFRIPNSKQAREAISEQPEIRNNQNKIVQKKGIMKKIQIEIAKRPSSTSNKVLPKAHFKKPE